VALFSEMASTARAQSFIFAIAQEFLLGISGYFTMLASSAIVFKQFNQ